MRPSISSLIYFMFEAMHFFLFKLIFTKLCILAKLKNNCGLRQELEWEINNGLWINGTKLLLPFVLNSLDLKSVTKIQTNAISNLWIPACQHVGSNFGYDMSAAFIV